MPATAVHASVIFQVASPNPAYCVSLRWSVRPKKVLPTPGKSSASCEVEVLNGPVTKPLPPVVITSTARSWVSCSRYTPATKFTGELKSLAKRSSLELTLRVRGSRVSAGTGTSNDTSTGVESKVKPVVRLNWLVVPVIVPKPVLYSTVKPNTLMLSLHGLKVTS